MIRPLLAVALLGISTPALSQAPLDSAALRHSVEQLRSSIGKWNVAPARSPAPF
ncbi:MAG: hypothetical protein O2973_08700 [Gemmatimonadetes bacterium]|nr:hypothetical protein [Gemmatimonadota bacterium]